MFDVERYYMSLPSRERGLKYVKHYLWWVVTGVAPFAGAWIEIRSDSSICCDVVVAPFAGAWIEITTIVSIFSIIIVAPFAGAWIEIAFALSMVTHYKVAPFAGAWIEMRKK